MENSLELETKPGASGSAGRQTERIMVEIPIRVVIPIRVFSFGGSAGNFNEDTHTLMVNRDGALIATKHRLAPDETIRIINLENLREADFRVVGLAREESGDMCQWGVECLDTDRSLWEIDFPPPIKKNDAKGGALLQCESCGQQSLIVLSLTEISILEARGALEKLCEQCGQLTLWEYVDSPHLAKELPSPAAGPPAASDVEWDGRTDRRQPVIAPPTPVAVRVIEKTERRGTEIPLASQPATPGPATEATSPPTVVAAVPPPVKWDGKGDKRIHRRLLMKLPVQVRNLKGQVEVARSENISKGGLGVTLAMSLVLGERVKVVCPFSDLGPQIEQVAEVRRRISMYGGKTWLYGFRYITA